MAKAKTRTPGRFQNVFHKDAKKGQGVVMLSLIMEQQIAEMYNRLPDTPIDAKGETHREYHPSQIEKFQCIRKLALWRIGAMPDLDKSNFSSKQLRVFGNGHKVHDRHHEYLADMSALPNAEVMLVGRWECRKCDKKFGSDTKWVLRPKKCSCGATGHSLRYKEVPLFNKEYNIRGRTDGVLFMPKDGKATLAKLKEALRTKKDLYLLEIKSMNPFAYAKTFEVPSYYTVQANLYMQELGIYNMIFFIEDKATQDLKEFNIKYASKVLAPHMKRMAKANEYVAKKKLPPRLKEKRKCTACEFKPTCFKIEKFSFRPTADEDEEREEQAS